MTEAFYTLDRPTTLGEGPIYRNSDKTLHYVDCLHAPYQLHILQLDEDGNAKYPVYDFHSASRENTNKSKKGLRVVETNESVTVMCFRKNVEKSYICLYYAGIAFLDEETGKLDILKEIIPQNERHIRRFNDGGVDPKGRFWGAEIDVAGLKMGAGNIPDDYKPIGRLWRYDPDGSLHEMDEGLVCGNGIAWTPDGKRMFVNDSAGQRIWRYDFDLETGNISNKTCVREYFGTECEPDGMVCDVEGNLWIAMFGGYGVFVVDQDGNDVKEVPLACRNVACTTWGGPNSDIIYVATAYNSNDPDQGGHLFKFPAGIKGVGKYEFAG